MSEYIEEAEYFRQRAEFEQGLADSLETTFDRLRELAKADADGRIYVSKYPDCGMCERVTVDMFHTHEPCKSCKAAALAEMGEQP